MVFGFRPKKDEIFNFEGDYQMATNKSAYKEDNKIDEAVLIGTQNKKHILIPSNAKHIFVCGTTGSGKTIALSNFIKAGADYDYPMLIVDGKGDTDEGSLLNIVKTLCPNKKGYVIHCNDPRNSDKYNPFKNTRGFILIFYIITIPIAFSEVTEDLWYVVLGIRPFVP